MTTTHETIKYDFDMYDATDFFKTKYDNTYINLDGVIMKKYKYCEPKFFYGSIFQRTGYKYVSMGRGKKICIHRLMGETFLPNPNNLRNIDHIDRNKLNNNIKNLRWFSQQDNMLNVGGIKNVCFDKRKNKWLAKVGNETLGYYDTEAEARACKYGYLLGKNIQL